MWTISGVNKNLCEFLHYNLDQAISIENDLKIRIKIDMSRFLAKKLGKALISHTNLFSLVRK